MRKTSNSTHRICQRPDFQPEILGRTKTRAFAIRRNARLARDLVAMTMLNSPFNSGRLFGRRDKVESAHRIVRYEFSGEVLTITWASKQSPYRKFGGKRFLMERSSSHADLIRSIRRNCC